MSKLERAIAFAARSHSGQLDKAGKPYILHPLRVMLSLDDENLQIAAVLHDVVEDCGVDLDEIQSNWGQEIAEIVDRLSRREGETYMEFVDRCTSNKDAAKVKLMDLKDNMSPARFCESLAGIQKRYTKATEYILEVAFKEKDAKDIEFLTKNGFM